jgi:hypothetical protein
MKKALSLIVPIMALCYQIFLWNVKIPAPRRGIHPEVQQYVDRFVKLAKDVGNKDYKHFMLNIDIADSIKDSFNGVVTSDDVVGWCKPYIYPLQIMIQSEQWRTSSDMQREQLMFHELGHCLLRRQHDETTSPNGTPMSIMYPFLVPEHTYETFRDEYIKELFGVKK